jgi:hypothetical protein
MATTTNVTVELDTTDADAVVDQLDTVGHYSPAIHAAPGGRVAVTMTVPRPLAEAVLHALSRVAECDLPTFAVTALPTEEFDRRAGLTEEVPVMLSVAQAAERLGISEQRVRQLLTSSPPKLAGEKVGRDWLVNAASVTARMEGYA